MTFGAGLLACGMALSAEPYQVPQFRHAEFAGKLPVVAAGPVRLLADENFPPFSFRSGDGALTGLSVDLALEACREAALACEISARPWDGLLEALAKGEGDAVISGPRLTGALAARFAVSRTYMRAMARFAVRTETPIDLADIRSLAGKRVGVARGSAHAVWLTANFSQSAATEFANSLDAYEALRTGAIDAVFDDALKLIYWKSGQASRGCCKLLPGAFLDDGAISPALGIVAGAGRTDLRDAFDFGLDRAQASGAFAVIFRRYIPESPW